MKSYYRIVVIPFLIFVLFSITGCGGGTSTYTVTYNGNGNTGGTVPEDALNYTAGDIVAVRSNAGELTKTGYYFVGWNTQADGAGTNYQGGETFTMGTANMTLYANWAVTYSLRDAGPAGGLIFYDKGTFSDNWRYLEAAPSDQSDGIAWYNGTYVETDATSLAIGMGETNTAAIITVQGDGSYAAQVCNDLELGGYDDWFLPSKDELDAMYENLAAYDVGDFADTIYWSSTETLADFAYAQYLDSGSANDSEKDNTYRVRAARAF
jgi:uncharacterized repeat protein (TIGR02543 family)